MATVSTNLQEEEVSSRTVRVYGLEEWAVSATAAAVAADDVAIGGAAFQHSAIVVSPQLTSVCAGHHEGELEKETEGSGSDRGSSWPYLDLLCG